jgi:8-oxo-dGTP pyrophosphatase MutT (NUDIX family)
VTRAALTEQLSNYKTSFVEEATFIPQFLKLLEHQDAYQRHHLPGHLTGSAWIIDHTRKFALLTHHAKLNKWLQPGGHADGDENIFNVALREAEEETGLKNFKSLSQTFSDIDIHTIPARKDFPQHLHFDIRFVFQADKKEALVITQESHDLAWISIDNLTALTKNNPSIERMAEKISRLF